MFVKINVQLGMKLSNKGWKDHLANGITLDKNNYRNPVRVEALEMFYMNR